MSPSSLRGRLAVLASVLGASVALPVPAAASARRPQDPAPVERPIDKPVDVPKPPEQDAKTAPLPPRLEALVPGAMPADAAPEAVAMWTAVRNGLGAEPSGAPVTAFDLGFEARVWQPNGEGEKTLKNAQLRFLAPDFVDSALESGRRRLRGPRGDWIVDAKGQAQRLQGVELAQDRRELDQIVHVARTFANLVNVRSLRLRKLERIAAAPFQLPASMTERAAGKSWLSLVSPDFAIARHDGTKSERDVRVWLAIDSATHLPSLAVVAEDDRGTLAPESALLLELVNWTVLDGLRAPKSVRTFLPDTSGGTWRFQEKQNLQLWLTKGSLRAKLVPADFEPPRK
jgi:hypothetical protein